MSSVFDQYFQEFLGDESNEFDIFRGDDFDRAPEGLQHGDDGQLQDSVSSSALTPAPTFGTANPDLEGEMSLPENDARAGSLNDISPVVASATPCAWMSCSTRFLPRSDAELTAHHEDHLKEIHQEWSGPRGCDWANCASKATFKAPGSLKEHLFNIHINPLICTYSQCNYTKPFGKQYDLRRHLATAHTVSSMQMCPVQSCDAKITGFARKDKLLKHMREQHDHLRCPYNHCYATVLATEQGAHLQQVHGTFECALGVCEKGPTSCFSEIGLQRHLRKHHNMTFDPIKNLVREVRTTADKTARSPHIARLRKWKDCPSCSEAQRGSGSA